MTPRAALSRPPVRYLPTSATHPSPIRRVPPPRPRAPKPVPVQGRKPATGLRKPPTRGGGGSVLGDVHGVVHNAFVQGGLDVAGSFVGDPALGQQVAQVVDVVSSVVGVVGDVLGSSLASLECAPGKANWPGCAIPGGSVEKLVAMGLTPQQAADVATEATTRKAGGYGLGGGGGGDVKTRLYLR